MHTSLPRLPLWSRFRSTAGQRALGSYVAGATVIRLLDGAAFCGIVIAEQRWATPNEIRYPIQSAA
jgi:hypothetical protein